jgi:hypothetical protein
VVEMCVPWPLARGELYSYGNVAEMPALPPKPALKKRARQLAAVGAGEPGTDCAGSTGGCRAEARGVETDSMLRPDAAVDDADDHVLALGAGRSVEAPQLEAE